MVEDFPSTTELLHEFYESYSQDVYRYARLSLGNHPDALDVVQEVFLRAHKAILGYRDEANPRTWLLAIARNYMADLYRKRKTEQRYMQTATVLETFVHRDPAESIETLMYLEGLLFKLKDTYRQVVVLRHIEEYSVEETAHILGWTGAKVRTVDHRATKRLRALAALGAKGVDQDEKS